MEGNVAALRARKMPSIRAESTAGNPSPVRSFWTLDYDPFAGPGGNTPYTKRGVGILDWDSGDAVYVDEALRSLDICSF